MSVFVSDERTLKVSLGVAQVRLMNLARGAGLRAVSQVAYEGGAGLLLRVGPFGKAPGASRLVRVQFVEPVHRDGVMTLGVRWEAAGRTGGLFPVLDANISLADDGAGGTRMVLTAAYRPPFGELGAELDRLLLHRVATGTLRAFLARVANVLEGAAEAAAETLAPVSLEPGEEPAAD